MYDKEYEKTLNFVLAGFEINPFNSCNSGEIMHFKINKISTLNEKMKTSKTPSLSWQNKLISTALASVALILGSPQLALASLPVTTAVNMTPGSSNGTITASTSGGSGVLTITTSAPNQVINWVNFSDGTANGGILTSADTVNFTQPSVSSAVLNNITGGIPTVLGGSINSNGKLFFLNPAGIVVGANAAINAAAFYASTVSDATAIPYFVTNGTLGVFNGITPLLSSQTASGIIYVQSGATIAVTPGTGVVSLASSSNGSTPVTVVSSSSVVSGSVKTGSVITDNSAPSGSSLVSGITIDALSVNGALNLFTMGGNVITGNASATVQSLNTSGGYLQAPTGGSVNIYTNGGSYTNSGTLIANSNVVISTSNSYGTTPSTAALAAGSLTTYGNLNLTGYGVTGTAINASTSGTSVAVNGGLGAVSLVGNIPTISSITGTGSVSLTTTAITPTTVSSITSAGSVSVSTLGNVTISTVNASTTTGTLAVNAVNGSATVGTIGGTISTVAGNGNSTVNGLNGANLYNTKFNGTNSSNPIVTVTSSNSAGSAPINVNSVVVSGNLSVSNLGSLQGGVNITGVNVTTNTQTSTYGGVLSVTTGNGTTTFAGASTANTYVSVNSAGGNSSYSNPITFSSGASLAITSVNGANPNQGFSFVTNNGAITLSSVTTPNGGLVASSNVDNISITNTTGNLGGVVNLSANNGNIIVSGVNLLTSSITDNIASLTSNTINSTISWTGGTGNAAFTINDAAQNIGSYTSSGVYVPSNTGNNAVSSITLSTTGNLNVTNNIVAQQISLSALGSASVLYTGNVNTTVNAKSSVTEYTGSGNITNNLNANSIIGSGDITPMTLSLSAPTGNATYDTSVISNTVNGGLNGTNFNLTLTANAGNSNNSNVLILGSGATLTTNGLTLTGNTISSSVVISNPGTPSVSVTGNYVNLSGANNIKNLVLVDGTAGTTINSSSTSTMNVTGSVAGNLVVTANAGLNLGTNSTVINVSGTSNITTLTSTPGSGTVSVLGTLTGTVNVTTNNSSVTFGSATSTASLGQINATTGTAATGYPVTVYAITANLGSITANTLSVTSTGNIINPNGTVSASSGTLSSGTAASPGSITLGSESVTALNIAQAGNLSINAPGTSTVTANNQVLNGVILSGAVTYNQLGGSITTINANGNASQFVNLTSVNVGQENVYGSSGVTSVISNSTVSTLNATGSLTSTLTNGSVLTNLTTNTGSNSVTTVLNTGASVANINQISTTGSITLSTNNATVGTVSITTNGNSNSTGLINFTATNTPITGAGSYTLLNQGGLTVNASGNAGLGLNNSYALGNFNAASYITSNGSFTISNLTDSLLATGALVVSANAQGLASQTTPNAGTGVLTLGSGINLTGNNSSASVTFTSGSQNLGSVSDSVNSPISVYGNTVNFVGRTITLGGSSNPNNNFSIVTFTSNGAINYSESGTLALGSVTLGTAATSASFTSTTGNVYQTNTSVLSSPNTASWSFTARGTNAGTGTVGSVTLANANTIGSGISANPGSIGTISISATGNSSLRNGADINLGTIGIYNTGNGATLALNATTGNINQGSSSVWVYGNTTLNAAGNVTLAGAGNNFGQLTVTAGATGPTYGTGNATILETGTSAYTTVNANIFTATSAQGSIVLATPNTAITVQKANITASNGSIALSGTSGASNYNTGAITLVSSGNVSIQDSNATATIIGSGTNIGGNLIVINKTNSATITDSSGLAGVVVAGSASFTATGTNANVLLTNPYDSIGNGLFGNVSSTLSANLTGNLVILGGTTATTGIFTASGNISNQGGVATTKFGTLSLSTATGNVTLTDPLWVTAGTTGSLYIYAPLGAVNLGGLYKSIDLNGASPTVLSPNAQYIAPNP